MRLSFLSLLVSVFIVSFANAQSIVLSKDTVSYNGKPYCILKEIKMGRSPDYSVRALDGKELIYFKFIQHAADSSLQYNVTFKESNRQTEVKLADTRNLPEILVNSALVTDGSRVESNKEADFIVNAGAPVNQQHAHKYRLVSRSKMAPIIVVHDDITQEVTKIGSFQEKGSYINKVYTMQLAVYLPNGTKIAETQYPEKGANSVHIMTAKDGKQHTVTVSPTKNTRKQIFDWLVKNEYL